LKKSASALVLLLLVSVVLVSLPQIKMVKAENSRIYIRADGKVAGTDKIKREGDVYTFTGDIGTENWSYGITIQRDNIVVDGAGYILRGHGQTSMIDIFAFGKPIITGINLDGCSNVTIKNLQIWGFNSGFGGNCSNSKIVGNTITLNVEGIFFEGSYNNTISDNNIINNGNDGMLLNYCFNSTFCGNRISDSYYGIDFHYKSCNNTVSGNILTETSMIGINTRFSSKYNIFTGNIITNNHEGISIVTSNNIVTGNNISNNDRGIGISGYSNNTVSGNIITNNNEIGISLSGQAENNTISENNITNNQMGVKLREASNNTIYHNNLIDNAIQVYDHGVDSDFATPSVNQWDNSIEGNFWSGYNGTDNNRDGIGDTSHTVYENNTDRYPLMYPVVLEIAPPSISIISPQNATYTTGNVSLNFTVNEEASWMGYSLDGQNNVTVTENTLNFTELSDGSHSLTVYATDTAGNTGTSETINFTIETPSTTQITIAIAIIALIGAVFLVYFLKTKKTTKPK
jgi:parallel beta-helix repeat protein